MPKTDFNRLGALVAGRNACVAILTFEEEHALLVAREVALDRSCDLWMWSASVGLREGMLEGAKPIPNTENPAAALYFLLQDQERKGIVVMLDLAGHLEEKRCLRLLRELIARYDDKPGRTLILIDQGTSLPPVIANTAAKLELSYPGEIEIGEIIKRTLREVHQERKIEVSIGREDFDAIVRNLRGLTRRQVRQAVIDAVATDRRFDKDDIASVLRAKKQMLAHTGLLEFVEAPTSMDQIGGLGRLKAWLGQRKESFSEAAADYGIDAPRGVLLLGVQGAGKSLAAKAVATAWQRPLLRMDVGAFYDRFVGESERRLRDAFKQAEMMSPIVLWIDEIEKAFASASAQSADGGLSKRMFGALLTWMQEHTAPVFLIATANDIESLPPELMRKGRFDEIFFVDLPDAAARRTIFDIHLKRRKQDVAEYDLDALAAAAEGFSGAEIEQAVVAALHDAFSRNAMAGTETVLKAIRATKPLSVTMKERVAWLRSWAAERCVSAD
jgi:ATP-dependent 26S proteasome regulatory subunit/1,2-phenylacetyl-CoA epoxidase PaaB subunit